MCEEVVRILRSISGELSLSGGVLVLGDSTSAYCVDRMEEVSWSDLMARPAEACDGVNFYLESWPRATPRAFLSQVANAAWWGCSYDWVLLVGGWNSYGINGEEIETIFADLFTYCDEKLIRK